MTPNALYSTAQCLRLFTSVHSIFQLDRLSDLVLHHFPHYAAVSMPPTLEFPRVILHRYTLHLPSTVEKTPLLSPPGWYPVALQIIFTKQHSLAPPLLFWRRRLRCTCLAWALRVYTLQLRQIAARHAHTRAIASRCWPVSTQKRDSFDARARSVCRLATWFAYWSRESWLPFLLPTLVDRFRVYHRRLRCACCWW